MARLMSLGAWFIIGQRREGISLVNLSFYYSSRRTKDLLLQLLFDFIRGSIGGRVDNLPSFTSFRIQFIRDAIVYNHHLVRQCEGIG